MSSAGRDPPLTCLFVGQAVRRDDGFIVVLADIQSSLVESQFKSHLETFNLVKELCQLCLNEPFGERAPVMEVLLLNT